MAPSKQLNFKTDVHPSNPRLETIPETSFANSFLHHHYNWVMPCKRVPTKRFGVTDTRQGIRTRSFDQGPSPSCSFMGVIGTLFLDHPLCRLCGRSDTPWTIDASGQLRAPNNGLVSGSSHSIRHQYVDSSVCYRHRDPFLPNHHDPLSSLGYITDPLQFGFARRWTPTVIIPQARFLFGA